MVRVVVLFVLLSVLFPFLVRGSDISDNEVGYDGGEYSDEGYSYKEESAEDTEDEDKMSGCDAVPLENAPVDDLNIASEILLYYDLFGLVAHFNNSSVNALLACLFSSRDIKSALYQVSSSDLIDWTSIIAEVLARMEINYKPVATQTTLIKLMKEELYLDFDRPQCIIKLWTLLSQRIDDEVKRRFVINFAKESGYTSDGATSKSVPHEEYSLLIRPEYPSIQDAIDKSFYCESTDHSLLAPKDGEEFKCAAPEDNAACVSLASFSRIKITNRPHVLVFGLERVISDGTVKFDDRPMELNQTIILATEDGKSDEYVLHAFSYSFDGGEHYSCYVCDNAKDNVGSWYHYHFGDKHASGVETEDEVSVMEHMRGHAATFAIYGRKDSVAKARNNNVMPKSLRDKAISMFAVEEQYAKEQEAARLLKEKQERQRRLDEEERAKEEIRDAQERDYQMAMEKRRYERDDDSDYPGDRFSYRGGRHGYGHRDMDGEARGMNSERNRRGSEYYEDPGYSENQFSSRGRRYNDMDEEARRMNPSSYPQRNPYSNRMERDPRDMYSNPYSNRMEGRGYPRDMDEEAQPTYSRRGESRYPPGMGPGAMNSSAGWSERELIYGEGSDSRFDPTRGYPRDGLSEYDGPIGMNRSMYGGRGNVSTEYGERGEEGFRSNSSRSPLTGRDRNCPDIYADRRRRMTETNDSPYGQMDQILGPRRANSPAEGCNEYKDDERKDC